MKKIILLIITILSIIMISGCNKQVLYLDYCHIEKEKYSIESVSAYETQELNINILINILIKNTTSNTLKINIKKCYILKEDTKERYTVSYNDSISIDPKLTTKLSFESEIQSSYLVDNYSLYFTLNNTEYKLSLTSIPYELREDFFIDYYIINDLSISKFVYCQSIKKNTQIDEFFIYESSDYNSYCGEWYSTTNLNNKFKINSTIEDDICLYGKTISILDANSEKITKLLHDPSNKIIKIPTYNGVIKVTGILTNAIRNSSATTIYIPKSINNIGYGNFEEMPNLTKIYYEGSKEEWNKIKKQCDISSKITIYYDSYYSY